MSALISDRKIVTLESSGGLWRADVHPVGASLVALWFDGAEIVVSPYGRNFFAFAGATLAPWPNRLEDGTWIFADKTLKHAINDERGHNANHGLAFDREFRVVNQGSNAISLALDFGSDQVYPFATTLTVRYELSSEGLSSTITFTNRDNQIVPVALGAHPYFLLDANSEVEINAREVFQKSTRSLPLQTMSLRESDIAVQGKNPIAGLEIDDCFTALEENGDSRYFTRISRPSMNRTVEIWQDTLFNHLMLFVLREQGDEGRTTIAVEPQTSAANALRTNEGLQWIAPGEQISASWGIKINEGIFND
ncbi:MAG: hypothetical protein RL149_488 [Actinomycetota bacterium]